MGGAKTLRQFMCSKCPGKHPHHPCNIWHERVKDSNPWSKCKHCETRYPPVLRGQEVGVKLCHFHCTCGNDFVSVKWVIQLLVTSVLKVHCHHTHLRSYGRSIVKQIISTTAVNAMARELSKPRSPQPQSNSSNEQNQNDGYEIHTAKWLDAYYICTLNNLMFLCEVFA